MHTFREKSLRGLSVGGFHRISYRECGPERSDRTVICVHGLTRNSHDFDEIAPALAAEGFRVVCPDIVGRGRSGRLSVPSAYGFPQYLADMTALIARLEVERVDWVGTSMGGIIGMMAAAQPDTPVDRLVVNDVGPFIPADALRNIAGYVTQFPSFADIGSLERELRARLAGYAPMTDGQWRRLALAEARRGDDGRLHFSYDPAIAIPMMDAEAIRDVDLWPVYDAIRCPTLVLRGAESPVLTAETAREMSGRGPRAALVDFAGVGHAPPLMSEEQIAPVRDFLLRRD